MTCACHFMPLAPKSTEKSAATWALVWPVKFVQGGTDEVPNRCGKAKANVLARSVEFGPLRQVMVAWPFLLFQKPIVAVSPLLIGGAVDATNKITPPSQQVGPGGVVVARLQWVAGFLPSPFQPARMNCGLP